jgi:hypothetical protein
MPSAFTPSISIPVLPTQQLLNPTTIVAVSGVNLTPDLTYIGKMVHMQKDSAKIFYVPKDVTYNHPIGTSIRIRSIGTGSLTFSPEDAGVILNKRGSGNVTMAGEGGSAFVEKTDSNVWYVAGDITVTP